MGYKDFAELPHDDKPRALSDTAQVPPQFGQEQLTSSQGSSYTHSLGAPGAGHRAQANTVQG